MSSIPSNAEVERAARSTVAQDGLFEICLGAGLLFNSGWLVLSLLGGLGHPYSGWLIITLMVLGLAAARRRITYPRVGYVRFRRSGPEIAVFVILATTAVLGLTALFLAGRPGLRLRGRSWEILVAVLSLVGAALAAWIGHGRLIRRFYLYAGLAAVGAFLPWILGKGVEYRAVLMTGLPAVVMIPCGVLALRRFLRRYPKPELEVADGR